MQIKYIIVKVKKNQRKMESQSMLQSAKSDEKKISHKVFSTLAGRDDPSFLSFPEFVIICETEINAVKGIPTYHDSAVIADPKVVAKNAAQIVRTVNSYLAADARKMVLSELKIARVTVSWIEMRKILMKCFGNDYLNVDDEFSRLMKIGQMEDEAPNIFAQRFIEAQQYYGLAIDFVHGNGAFESAKAKLQSEKGSYPYYFYAENDFLMKSLYFRGLFKHIRDDWEKIKGFGSDPLKFSTMADIVRYAQNVYNSKPSTEKKSSDNPSRRSNTTAKAHVLQDDTSEEEDSSYKRTRLESSSDSCNMVKVADAMVLSTANIAKGIDKMCASNSKTIEAMVSLLKDKPEVGSRHTYSKPMVNTFQEEESDDVDVGSLYPVFQKRTRKAMNAGTGNSNTQVCWICQTPDHFAPKCPYISPTELYVIIYNQLYRANLKDAKTPGYKAMTFEQFCQKWGITPPTDEEVQQLEQLYEPLKNKVPRAVEMKGTNEKAYCHFCHANGHYTRDCKRRCVYCLKSGHGWKTCTAPQYQTVITARKNLLPRRGDNRSMVIHERITSLLHCQELVDCCA